MSRRSPTRSTPWTDGPPYLNVTVVATLRAQLQRLALPVAALSDAKLIMLVLYVTLPRPIDKSEVLAEGSEWDPTLFSAIREAYGTAQERRFPLESAMIDLFGNALGPSEVPDHAYADCTSTHIWRPEATVFGVMTGVCQSDPRPFLRTKLRLVQDFHRQRLGYHAGEGCVERAGRHGLLGVSCRGAGLGGKGLVWVRKVGTSGIWSVVYGAGAGRASVLRKERGGILVGELAGLCMC